jgi:hypothetical protein
VELVGISNVNTASAKIRPSGARGGAPRADDLEDRRAAFPARLERSLQIKAAARPLDRPLGVDQAPALIGTVMRAKAHDGGAAGYVASFIAVKQP